jgi:hypothetical protein
VLLGAVERQALGLDLADEAVRELGAGDVRARLNDVLGVLLEQRDRLLLERQLELGGTERRLRLDQTPNQRVERHFDRVEPSVLVDVDRAGPQQREVLVVKGQDERGSALDGPGARRGGQRVGDGLLRTQPEVLEVEVDVVERVRRRGVLGALEAVVTRVDDRHAVSGVEESAAA